MRIDLSAINPITSEIIKGAVEVHRRFGPGLLESVYQQCFAFELRALGFAVIEGKRVPLEYKGIHFKSGFQIDLLVNDTVIVEVKAGSSLAPIHEAQLLTYLRLMNRPVGLLINFNVPLLKDGVSRKLNPSFTEE